MKTAGSSGDHDEHRGGLRLSSLSVLSYADSKADRRVQQRRVVGVIPCFFGTALNASASLLEGEELRQVVEVMADAVDDRLLGLCGGTDEGNGEASRRGKNVLLGMFQVLSYIYLVATFEANMIISKASLPFWRGGGD